MKTNYGFWSYLAECSLDWEIFWGRDVEKIKIHILCLLFFFLRKSCCLRDNVGKYFTARQARWQYNMAHAHCVLDNQGYRHTLRIYNSGFPRQKLSRESALVLRYTYIACPVWSSVVQSWEFWHTNGWIMLRGCTAGHRRTFVIKIRGMAVISIAPAQTNFTGCYELYMFS